MSNNRTVILASRPGGHLNAENFDVGIDYRVKNAKALDEGALMFISIMPVASSQGPWPA